MKKILMLFIATVCLVACSKGDEPNEQPEMSKEVRELWTTLNGKFSTTVDLANTESVWYTETITFKPYKELKKIMPPFTDQKGDIYAFGEVDIKDSRFISMSGVQRCYYSLYMRLGKPTISFYQFSDDNGDSWGREDCRNIEIIDASEFEMWPYGTSKPENVHIYTRI